MADYVSEYSGEQIDALLGKVETPDTTPVAESSALITSGGVKAAVSPKYEKPSGGIPKTDLASAVQSSLDKADASAAKDTDAVQGNIAVFDANGNPVDSGKSVDDIGGKPGVAIGIADTQSPGTEQMFTKRQSGGGGVAVIKRIKGNSIVWNQLTQNGNFSNGTTGWDAYRSTAELSDGVVTITPTVSNNTAGFACPATGKKWVEGHKYLITIIVKGNAGKNITLSGYAGGLSPTPGFTPTGNWERQDFLYTARSADAAYNTQRIAVVQSADENLTPFYLKSLQFFDLTQMVGAGNEPSTAAEFEALYGLEYYAQNSGTIRNNTAEKLVTTGFNQWDEVWEYNKYWWPVNGVITKHAGTIDLFINKEPIPVKPNTTYWITCGYFSDKSSYSGFFNVRCADADMNEVSLTFSNGFRSFTTPADAAFIVFNCSSVYGNTYRNDICINISDASRNGTYEPYQTPVEVNLGLTTMTGKKDGEGESVTIFGNDGMKRVGSVYDETDGKTAEKLVGIVDLGTLDWSRRTISDGEHVRFTATLNNIKAPSDNSTSGNVICSKYQTDTATALMGGSVCVALSTTPLLQIYDSSLQGTAEEFKTAMSGVYLIYELATPEEYILDNPIDMMYFVDEDGTEEATQPSGASLPAAPFVCDTNYSIRIQKLLQVINNIINS